MNQQDRLALHVRTHISGITIAALLDAGFTTTDIATALQNRRVRLVGGNRVHHIAHDLDHNPDDGIETR
ncbi:hypothetical protein CH253_26715 [Rhodococcus sp. 06-156-3C]|uniref:hypothetical protein n=1 Tax=Nocardiaceae TaxID=85025 RepID=UPI000522FBD0|nr:MULTISPECIES: hypothetical protein [Rhodococcus]OZD12277.1 hypothetical protein CH253_26715 [Rhodococcus sp. 06-156-3C]OZD19057.1 hypothetical protein CH280_05135 [Rhodococcus sp. 06-156-4C]OZD20903.1 hypothetical protein CH248_11590 [Rhodococcus sp. 06-156-4a]OZD29078.1 hypothetical protein CH247_19185 [Rhodococcus sp. 06-156-3b]OZD33635.1 hypothetical protein CH284_18655 [Rhodococcus sp. 06-156-3]